MTASHKPLFENKQDFQELKDYICFEKSIVRKKINSTCIVIPTYNQREITIKTLNELIADDSPCDYLIIDNDSTDDTLKGVVKVSKHANVLKTRNNYGGAGAQYLGCRYAFEKGYDHIILSDNDAYMISKGLISQLIKSSKTFKGKACICPKNICDLRPAIKHVDREHSRIASVGFTYTTLHRSIIQKIGFPDFDYFLSFDDTDYMFRIIHNKVPIVQVDKLKVFHEGAKFVGYFSPLSTYLYIRNTIKFCSKSYVDNRTKVSFFLSFVILMPTLKSFYYLSYGHSLKRIKWLLRGYIDAVQGKYGKPSIEDENFRNAGFIQEISRITIGQNICLLGSKADMLAIVGKKTDKHTLVDYSDSSKNQLIDAFKPIFLLIKYVFNKNVKLLINARYTMNKIFLLKSKQVVYFIHSDYDGVTKYYSINRI